MNFLDKIKRWPIEKKRFFSILIALLLTILILVLNFKLNLIWKDDTKNVNIYIKNNPVNDIQESFSKVVDGVRPVFDKIFGSSTKVVPASFTKTGQIIDQINSTSSSLSTTSNMIK